MPLPQLQFLDVGRAMESGRRNALADLQMAEAQRQMQERNALRAAMQAGVTMTPGPVQVPTGFDQQRFVTEAMRRGAPAEAIMPMLQAETTKNALTGLLQAGGSQGGGGKLTPDAIVRLSMMPGGEKYAANLWKLYESQNPKLENVPGVGMVNPITGRPVSYLPRITDSGRAAGVRFGPNGEPIVYTPQGSLEAFNAFQTADEAARARFRFSPSQPADPSQPPRMVSDAERAGFVPSGVPPITGYGNSGTRANVPTAPQAKLLIQEAQTQLAEKGAIDPELQRELQRYKVPIPSAPATQAFDPRAAGPSPKAKAVSEAEAAATRGYAEGAAKGAVERDTKDFQAAQDAVTGIQKIDDLLSHLRTSEAITGMGAELLTNIERAKTLLLKQELAGKKVSDTEMLNSMLGSDVFPMIGALGIGAKGMDTPAEREFLREVMTGTIKMNKDTLIRMAELRRKYTQKAVDRFNERVDRGELDRFFAGSNLQKRKFEVPKIPRDPNSAPEGVEPAVWGAMTPQERALWR